MDGACTMQSLLNKVYIVKHQGDEFTFRESCRNHNSVGSDGCLCSKNGVIAHTVKKADETPWTSSTFQCYPEQQRFRSGYPTMAL